MTPLPLKLIEADAGKIVCDPVDKALGEGSPEIAHPDERFVLDASESLYRITNRAQHHAGGLVGLERSRPNL